MYIRIYNVFGSKKGTGDEFTVDVPIDNDRDIREQLDDYLFDHNSKPDYYEWDIIEDTDNFGRDKM